MTVSSTVLPASIRLGRVAGIPVALHFSCLILVGVIASSVAGWFRVTQVDWEPVRVWAASAVTAGLFLVTLLAHELAHAWTAQRQGVPVKSITVLALGGVTHIDEDATSARADFLIAVVGPIASVAIGLVALMAGRSFGSPLVGPVLECLGLANLVLGMFSLLPAYPLDGGRILRAMFWAALKDPDRATRLAARTGQVIASLLIIIGLFRFVGGGGFGGLGLALVAWFLLLASGVAHAQVGMSQRLRGVRVEAVANDCAVVDSRTSLRSLVDDVLLRAERRCLLVQSDGRVLGLLTPEDIRLVDRRSWPNLAARDVMRPVDALPSVTPDMDLIDVLDMMARRDVTALPVVIEGQVRGVVSCSHIWRWLTAAASHGRREGRQYP